MWSQIISSSSRTPILPSDNYCLMTIFWPCPEVAIISDTHCTSASGAKVAEWKSLFVRITGKHKPSDWFFSPSNLLLHEFLIHNHWKLTPATTHVWQANNISTAQLNSVAVAGREAAARRPPSYPIQSSPVSRG